MAARISVRYVTRRLSSGGKVLSEEEKAAENVYIKAWIAMAARISVRYVTQRLSSGGKVLSEEEKAAENVYIKKMEQDKLEKLVRKGPQPGEQPPANPEAPATGAKPSTTEGSSSAGVSTDQNRNYAVLAGTVAALSGLGWYLLSKPKKSEEPVD